MSQTVSDIIAIPALFLLLGIAADRVLIFVAPAIRLWIHAIRVQRMHRKGRKSLTVVKRI